MPLIMSDARNDFATLLEEYAEVPLPQQGKLLHGKVISVNDAGLIVDLGRKWDGIVPQVDLERLGENDGRYRPGDEIDVMVASSEEQDGNLILSAFQARQNQIWNEADALLESGGMWIGTVTGENRGGLIVPYGDLRGFVPASHVVNLPRGASELERHKYFQSMVGQEIGLKMIEVDRRRERLVFSQREAQHAWRTYQRKTLLEQLHEGQVLTGTVSGLRDFGVFVDLGGADGLIHVSELAWHRVNHPRELVLVSQQIDVKVISVDSKRHRIGLSVKQLLPNPWEHVADRIVVGQMITGRITRVASFGAFVELGEGIEGLLHKSEIPPEAKPLVMADHELTLKVINVDVDRQRVGLRLRGIETQPPAPDPDLVEINEPPGDLEESVAMLEPFDDPADEDEHAIQRG